MKNLYFVIFVLMLLSCTQSPEKKAQKAVTTYLQQNLDDWKSYESISYSSIDSLMTNFEDDHKILLSDSSSTIRILNASIELRDFYISIYDIEGANKVKKECDSVYIKINIIDSLLLKCRKSWESSFAGYSIKHKFRAKNKIGNSQLHEVYFQVNSDFTSVEPIFDLGDSN